jgi:GNAT superfamily N-acetyltransferase
MSGPGVRTRGMVGSSRPDREGRPSSRDVDEARENIRGAYRLHARGFPRSRYRADPELELIDSGSDLAELNVAFLADSADDPRQAVRRAAEFFSDRPSAWRLESGRPMTPEFRESLEAAGLTELERRPALIAALPAEVGSAPEPTVEVRRVDSADLARTFADVLGLGSGFVPPPELRDVPYDRLDPLRCFLAYVGEVPAACSMSYVSRGLVGIYAVATLPAYRRRGLAGSLARHALRAGASVGCRAACLQSSQMALPLYTEVGFRPAFESDVWTAPASP